MALQAKLQTLSRDLDMKSTKDRSQADALAKLKTILDDLNTALDRKSPVQLDAIGRARNVYSSWNRLVNEVAREDFIRARSQANTLVSAVNMAARQVA